MGARKFVGPGIFWSDRSRKQRMRVRVNKNVSIVTYNLIKKLLLHDIFLITFSLIAYAEPPEATNRRRYLS